MKLKLSKVVEILRTSTQLVRTRQRHGCSTQALMVVGFNPIPIAPGGLMGGCCAPLQEVSDDGRRVRRVAPLPEMESPDAQVSPPPPPTRRTRRHTSTSQR